MLVPCFIEVSCHKQPLEAVDPFHIEPRSRGDARRFWTGRDDSSNEGAKLQFSGYYDYQEFPKKEFFTF